MQSRAISLSFAVSMHSDDLLAGQGGCVHADICIARDNAGLWTCISTFPGAISIPVVRSTHTLSIDSVEPRISIAHTRFEGLGVILGARLALSLHSCSVLARPVRARRVL